jgi:signal transduction histidine kinase
VATGTVAYGDLGTPVNVGIYLIIATVAGAIGFALRVASARGHRLEEKLALQAEQEKEAVLAERRWIAGELHDSIAHHLTVVALHVQMLDDPAISRDSQEAIRSAAKKAMADLRFVIELADDGPRASVVQTGDLAEAIDEARAEIEAAGHPVITEGDPADERLPRIAEIVLARIVRESATNILKHAGQGEVHIDLDVDDESAALSIRSPLPATPRRDLPSSGTGLNRMAERVIGASGAFSAQADDGDWRVSAKLPII